MKVILKKVLLLQILFAIVFNAQTQIWNKLGDQKWPTNPYNLTNYGPGNAGNIGVGNFQSLWVDPADSNHVLVGVFGGGIYETNNAITGSLTNPISVTWNKISNSIPNQNVEKVVKKNGVIYATNSFVYWFGIRRFSNVHSQYQNLHGLGVIKSIDNGLSWSIPVMPDSERGFQCKDFTEPDSNGVMYAVSGKRVYKSTNSGNSWFEVGPQFFSTKSDLLSEVIVNPQNTQEVWISAEGRSSNLKHLFKSSDGGNTWQEM
ncbi:MAG: hypothetical protein DI529_17725, partial [Chryseobacterium sp.]